MPSSPVAAAAFRHQSLEHALNIFKIRAVHGSKYGGLILQVFDELARLIFAAGGFALELGDQLMKD